VKNIIFKKRKMTSFTREDYIYYARLAEQGERYEDMIRYMKEVSRVGIGCSKDN
jgi:hypothetical protein